MMEAASAVNAYLNANEPWKTVKTEPARAATVLWTAIQAIATLRVGLAPYLPFTTRTVGTMLGLGEEVVGWAPATVPAGTTLGAVSPLFTKLEIDALDD
jgi:methionyl-tRNA synthetase